MSDQEEINRRGAYGQLKASRDVAMGVIYMIISAMAVQTNYIIESYGKVAVWSIALLFILYGLFRLYRGLQFYLRKG